MIKERNISDRADDVEKKEHQRSQRIEKEREAGSYCTLYVLEAEPPPYNGTGGLGG